jgi:periplasmic divalent cation tolerance protein
MSGRWVGLTYDDRIMSGFASMGHSREESERTMLQPDQQRRNGIRPMSELCEVVITAPDPDWLRAFTRKLVEDRLCASVHNFAPVLSIYRWRDEVHERTEGRASLHTSRGRVAEIVERAKKEHPYEVPGVSARSIIDGNPDYLAWIEEQTAPHQQSSDSPVEA